MHSNRNEALDLLRIIAALGVIIIHVIAWYSDHALVISQNSLTFTKTISALTFSGSRVFLLLSGYFLLGHLQYSTFEKALAKFWHSSYLAIFWSVVFSIVFIFEKNGFFPCIFQLKSGT
ncbi:hypothetical protein CO112_02530 [Candidatus Dojkabacteria bacterium CG_4_9_14_3_um_filter_150_Dojkabacteria_WS6_41_13]|uniref:Acyltransferase 3 domain-containing protein n=1 Tax=Candidatus Dojkabacteria bacterium CG_4_10_14_0_2_um_filter_Dojkabacteria_WS6_41_15 TaxID=2014249 RepID=A0A2M7W235_9BACT|nr:MAG: hypothetical protein COZ14_02380 [Candidatus Dojkabacteria bacterium CG_4_10_14_3_um_filter_Dojkabacteria_WS6_41_9]PJA14276.1 MAG: hypothetical protein COX64_02375 [Candidatus Dojkabacteria bacterium CG_4_10_14_0_2_um_filter_Dojkabacteria_WS6_41_15]PJB22782.1 MAG: hypothetical protein CO112_02530 [Candidatus Dojkabacteria bacterium CG_4_9_14_3_um_filter_150_Dojkabacteria_WS6_41_13]